MSERPNDLELLRAIYRRVDRAGLCAEFPGLTDQGLRDFFCRLSVFIKPEDATGTKATAVTAEGGCATPARATAVTAGGGGATPAKRGVLHADGGSRGNPGLSGFGCVLLDESGKTLAEKGECIGKATNNEAEYRGLIAGLRLALDQGVTDLEVRMDSDLVVHQVRGEWKVRTPHLMPLVIEARGLLERFASWRARHVPREHNARADQLANDAMDRGR